MSAMSATIQPGEERGRDDNAFVAPATPTIITPVRLCQQHARRGDARTPYARCSCLELFRRAVVERDDDAWAEIYALYAGRVRGWLGTASQAQDDEEVTMVFERFWHAVDGAKFSHFHSLGAVLQYLKMCALSMRMDRGRAIRATASEYPLDATHDAAGPDDVEETVTRSIDAAVFWRLVRALLPDERERRLLYLSYVAGLSPREIRARDHNSFPDVGDIYRLKRNILDRLRRAPEIQSLVRPG